MLTATEQMSVKRHLGMSSASPSLYPLVTVFITAGQILSTLPAETETEVRAILTRLDNLEAAIDDAPTRFVVEKLGSIETRDNEATKLWTEVKRWRCELAVLTGLPNLRNRSMMVV